MHQECDISVITVNYNGLEDTCQMIDSLPQPAGLRIELIVVDNASRSDEATVIAQRYPWVKVIRSHKNRGFAGGNNLGINAANGHYLFLINNDTDLAGADLLCLKNCLDTHPEIAVVCPKLRYYDDSTIIQFAGYTELSPITLRNHAVGMGEQDKGQYDLPHALPYMHGAAMMVRREALDKVGLMPELYFLYYEEYDWAERFKEQGYQLWYEPRCVILHKESRSTGIDSPLKTYYLTRNRLIFARRNLSPCARWISYAYQLLLAAPLHLLQLLMKGRRQQAKALLSAVGHFVLRQDTSSIQ